MGKIKKDWKTKINSKGERMMICQNSEPNKSKWGEFAPPGGCTNFEIVGNNTTSVLCSNCTTETLKF